MEFLTVGQVVRTIGLKGEVQIYPSTHFRDTRFKKGSRVFLLNDNGEIERELTIKLHRTNGDCDNLIFEEITSIEEAEKINKKYLFVEKNPEILKNSRKVRIAKGCGKTNADINRLLKKYEQMQDMMKRLQQYKKTGRMPPGGLGIPGAGGLM